MAYSINLEFRDLVMDGVSSIVQRFSIFEFDEEDQFSRFKSEMFEYLRVKNRRSVFNEALRHYAGTYSSLWIGLLGSSLNLKIAKYLMVLGLPYNDPVIFAQFLVHGICLRLPAMTDSPDINIVNEWLILTARVDSILQWFIDDLLIGPNSNVFSTLYSTNTGDKSRLITILGTFCYRLRTDSIVTNYTFQRLIFYGGDILRDIETNTGRKPIYSGTLFQRICGVASNDVVILPATSLLSKVGTGVSRLIFGAERNIPSNSSRRDFEETWDVTIDGWIALALTVFARDSKLYTISTRQDGGLQQDVENIMLPNGSTMIESGALFASKYVLRQGALKLSEAGLDMRSLDLLNSLGVIHLGDDITEQWQDEIIDEALYYGALDVLKFFVIEMGWTMPDDALVKIRPDLINHFASHLGEYGISKMKKLRMERLLERRR